MTLNRRQFTQAAAALAASGATPLVFAADTIKIGYYLPKPDPIGDALLRVIRTAAVIAARDRAASSGFTASM